MPWLSPRERQRRRERLFLWLLVASLLLLVTTLLDRVAFGLFLAPESVKKRDWYQLFRQVGYWPTWGLIGTALILHSRRRRTGAVASRWSAHSPGLGTRAGLLTMTSAALAGLGAELLKLIVGRARPGAYGHYTFKPFLSGFLDGSNLGMPSSHAACSFGAAWMLTRFYPRAGVVALVAAAGCCLTRLLSGAHFLSDVTVGIVLAYALSGTLYRLAGPRRSLPAL